MPLQCRCWKRRQAPRQQSATATAFLRSQTLLGETLRGQTGYFLTMVLMPSTSGSAT